MNRFAIVAAACMVALPMCAQRKSATKSTTTVLKTTQSGGPLWVEIVATAGGAPVVGGASGVPTLDIGAVSYAGARSGKADVRRSAMSFVVATRFGLLVHSSSSNIHSAMVSAAVAPGCPYQVSIDGQLLGTAPQLLAGRLPVGSISQHRLEIEIPKSLTEKTPAASLIRLEVIPE